jgi:excinuclease UvrABC ATPase subunit
MTYEGLLPRIERLHMVKDVESLQPHVRRIATFAACPACDGTRLNATARSVTVAGRTIAECARHVVAIADHIVDLGPGAGVHGGTRPHRVATA